MVHTGYVTVTGGNSYPSVELGFDGNDLAFKLALQLAIEINDLESSRQAIIYDPAHPPIVPSTGELIIPGPESGVVDARGFGQVIVVNDANSNRVKVLGGGKTNQTVLASDGGLSFSSARGNVTVVAGGGDNYISFNRNRQAHNTGTNAAYTSIGNDTIIGGDGSTTISAGGGDNTIFTRGGQTNVVTSGSDTINVFGGSFVTVNVTGDGSALVHGGTKTSTLVFSGGSNASTVIGGQGSVSIQGGAGGGVFRGGLAGGNYIYGGSGSATIIGGGAGDTLIGGTGSGDYIRAGAGNETLGGGGGATEFQFNEMKHAGSSAQITDQILDFTEKDTISLIGYSAAEINYALNTYTVDDYGGSFSLADGTKIVLQGYTGSLAGHLT